MRCRTCGGSLSEYSRRSPRTPYESEQGVMVTMRCAECGGKQKAFEPDLSFLDSDEAFCVDCGCELSGEATLCWSCTEARSVVKVERIYPIVPTAEGLRALELATEARRVEQEKAEALYGSWSEPTKVLADPDCPPGESVLLVNPRDERVKAKPLPKPDAVRVGQAWEHDSESEPLTLSGVPDHGPVEVNGEPFWDWVPERLLTSDRWAFVYEAPEPLSPAKSMKLTNHEWNCWFVALSPVNRTRAVAFLTSGKLKLVSHAEKLALLDLPRVIEPEQVEACFEDTSGVPKI